MTCDMVSILKTIQKTEMHKHVCAKSINSDHLWSMILLVISFIYLFVYILTKIDMCDLISPCKRFVLI